MTRFYDTSGVLPEAGRTDDGYRVFGEDAVAAAHDRAIDTQIRVLRLRRALLHAFIRSDDPEELSLMTGYTALSAEEGRRIVDDYLDAVFGSDAGDEAGDGADRVAAKFSMGAPELPDDPTPEQLAAWAEVIALLRDPDFIDRSRRMAQRALAEGPEPDPAQFELGKAVRELAGPAYRAGLDPASAEARAIVERIEARAAASGGDGLDRAAAADRIEAFTDRRVGRYWTLVGVVNGWPASQAPADVVDAWEWYARPLRAHP